MSRLGVFATFGALTLSLAAPSTALACAEGARCATAPENAQSAAFASGDTLPRGKYQVLLNSEYYGLPPAANDAWYFRVDERVMRVNPLTLEVIEDVTELTNAAF